jgi:hypothetical protein
MPGFSPILKFYSLMLNLTGQPKSTHLGYLVNSDEAIEFGRRKK